MRNAMRNMMSHQGRDHSHKNQSNGTGGSGFFGNLKRAIAKAGYNIADVLRGTDGFETDMGDAQYHPAVMNKLQYYPGDFQPQYSPQATRKLERQAYKEYLKSHRRTFFKDKRNAEELPDGLQNEAGPLKGLGTKTQVRLAKKLQSMGKEATEIARGVAEATVNVTKAGAEAIGFNDAVDDLKRTSLNKVADMTGNEEVKDFLKGKAEEVGKGREHTKLDVVNAYKTGVEKARNKGFSIDGEDDDFTEELVLPKSGTIHLKPNVLYEASITSPTAIDTREFTLSCGPGLTVTSAELHNAKPIEDTNKEIVHDQILVIPNKGKIISIQRKLKTANPNVGEVSYSVKDDLYERDGYLTAYCKVLYFHPRKGTSYKVLFKLGQNPMAGYVQNFSEHGSRQEQVQGDTRYTQTTRQPQPQPTQQSVQSFNSPSDAPTEHTVPIEGVKPQGQNVSLNKTNTATTSIVIGETYNIRLDKPTEINLSSMKMVSGAGVARTGAFIQNTTAPICDGSIITGRNTYIVPTARGLVPRTDGDTVRGSRKITLRYEGRQLESVSSLVYLHPRVNQPLDITFTIETLHPDSTNNNDNTVFSF